VPLPGETQREWLSYDLGVDWEAVKKTALPILSKYTARTNGSFVKLTHSSLGWTYYSCDPEWGALQASYLVPELERELSAFDVRFVTLKGVVEVVPRKLNKGLVVKKILEEVAGTTGGKPVDFILCMGDDVSDEKMFTSVFSFIAESNAASIGTDDSVMEDVSKDQAVPMHAFTVAVGKKKTHASYYVDSSRDVPHLLVGMSGGHIPISQSSSWESDGSGSKRDVFA
jgi:trehalose 6-phosphate synthase/phosphatase